MPIQTKLLKGKAIQVGNEDISRKVLPFTGYAERVVCVGVIRDE